VKRLSPTVLAALAIAGCGYGSPQTPEQETKEPLKIQHAVGETKVPGRSTRPVMLATGELEDSLALGVVPAGAAVPAAGAGFPHFLGRRARAVEPVGPVARPEVRRVSALDPDLILGVIPKQRRLYRRLTDVAPTVMADSRVNWKPNLRQDGEALGHTDEAEAMLSDYDRRALRLRRALRGRDLTRAEQASALPAAVRPYLGRPFIASILADVGLPHAEGRPRAARPGPHDAWSLGEGVIAARLVLRDLDRWLVRARG
jgi:iron complex transport system substrate-binding protein